MERYFSTRPAWLVLILVASLDVSVVCALDDKKIPAPQLGQAILLERFSWKIMDWAYPDEKIREAEIWSGAFQPENGLPVGIEVWGNKLFVVTPRWKAGVPATLNYIPLDRHIGQSPKLTPYPSWEGNKAGVCGSSLTTAYRIHADKCNRLWVLDSGTMPLGNGTIQACPYTLKIFDLTTDKIIRQYEFPPQDLDQNTFIANIAVDLGKGGCDDAFAYMSDELGYGLIVYDWRANTSWRVTHSFFYPDPLATDFKVAGLNYQRPKEGIFGMALSPIQQNGYRILFFHPFSSNREFAVSTKILRDEKLAMNSFHEFQALEERYKGHSTSQVMDENGLMLFNLIEQNAVGCWNSLLPYKPENHALIAKHDEALIFPSDVKIVNGVVWIISDRMAIFTESKLDFSEVNFRIFTVPLQDAIAGTVCQNKLREKGTVYKYLW